MKFEVLLGFKLIPFSIRIFGLHVVMVLIIYVDGRETVIHERVCKRVRCGGGVEGKRVEDGGEGVGSWDEYMVEFFGGGKGRRSGGVVLVIISGCRFWRRSRKCLGLMMGFLGRLKRCRDLEGMEELLGETWNGLGMGHLNRLECSDGEFSGEVA